MRYVARDAKAVIVAVFDRPHAAAPEAMKESDPEMLAFVTGMGSEEALRQHLATSENDLLRILEDLINVLIDNNVMLLTDLPPGAQRKLMQRQSIRDKLRAGKK
jgi:TctA family transporter